MVDTIQKIVKCFHEVSDAISSLKSHFGLAKFAFRSR